MILRHVRLGFGMRLVVPSYEANNCIVGEAPTRRGCGRECRKARGEVIHLRNSLRAQTRDKLHRTRRGAAPPLAYGSAAKRQFSCCVARVDS